MLSSFLIAADGTQDNAGRERPAGRTPEPAAEDPTAHEDQAGDRATL